MEICRAPRRRGEGDSRLMENLNGHEAGNGGHSQGDTYQLDEEPIYPSGSP